MGVNPHQRQFRLDTDADQRGGNRQAREDRGAEIAGTDMPDPGPETDQTRPPAEAEYAYAITSVRELAWSARDQPPDRPGAM